MLNTRTCTGQRLLLADHAQPVGMRLSAYFGKRLHGVLSWTRARVNTRTSTAQLRTPVSRPARQYHRPASHAHHRHSLRHVTDVVLIIVLMIRLKTGHLQIEHWLCAKH